MSRYLLNLSTPQKDGKERAAGPSAEPQDVPRPNWDEPWLAGLARQLEELCRELARMPTVADRGEGGRPTYGFSRLRTAGKSR